MSTSMSPELEQAFQRVIDLCERVFILLLFANFAVALSHSIVLKPYNILLLISEGLIALFMVIRRPSRNVTTRPLDWLIAMCGTCLPMFARAGGQPLLPAVTGTALMFAGVMLGIWAKLSLRRSFGMAAANRGAVIGGPYRLVRHPMYAGYITVYVGFLLNNPLPRNLYIYAGAVLVQVMRILAEERILKTDPAYDSYSKQVRFRLIPALF
jgi:protein-S-isoprenylcysteine O-methyltransferase Ste14